MVLLKVAVEHLLRNSKERAMAPILKVYQEPIANGLPLPSYAHEGDVGMDVPAAEATRLEPQTLTTVRTGLRFIIPRGYYLHMYTRSNTHMRGISCGGGIIDEGYIGQIHVLCRNFTVKPIMVHRGDALVQLILREYIRADIQPATAQEMQAHQTERGGHRFGSTGISRKN